MLVAVAVAVFGAWLSHFTVAFPIAFPVATRSAAGLQINTSKVSLLKDF